MEKNFICYERPPNPKKKIPFWPGTIFIAIITWGEQAGRHAHRGGGDLKRTERLKQINHKHTSYVY